MPERLECEVLQTERYINSLTYLPTSTCIIRLRHDEVTISLQHATNARDEKKLLYRALVLLGLALLSSERLCVFGLHGAACVYILKLFFAYILLFAF